MAVDTKAAKFGCLMIFSTLAWSGEKRIASVSAQVIAPRKGHAIRTQIRMPATLAAAKAKRSKRLLRGDPALCFIRSTHNQIKQKQPDA